MTGVDVFLIGESDKMLPNPRVDGLRPSAEIDDLHLVSAGKARDELRVRADELSLERGQGNHQFQPLAGDADLIPNRKPYGPGGPGFEGVVDLVEKGGPHHV